MSETGKENAKHDPYFKAGLKIPEISLPTLKRWIPAHIQKDMDLEQVRYESETLVGERLGRKVVDVLFSVPYKGRKSFIYILIEHQSTVEKWMALRLILYVLSILEDLVHKSKGKLEALPVVFPMVYYNGEAEYHGCLNLCELSEDPEVFKEILTQDMTLINTHQVDEESLKVNAWFFVFHMLMKNVWDDEIRSVLLDLIPYMLQIEQEATGVDFIVKSLNYVMASARNCDIEVVQEVAEQLQRAGGDLMTVVEQLLKKGREQGIEQGLEKGLEQGLEQGLEKGLEQGLEQGIEQGIEMSAKSMIKAGLDLTFIARCLGLPVDRVRRLAENP